MNVYAKFYRNITKGQEIGPVLLLSEFGPRQSLNR